MSARKITALALLIAAGTIAGVFAIPVFGARALPVQHAINVMVAVMFGPGPAVLVAFCIAVLRNLLGLGTPLAFPGGMIGALVAGLVFKMTGKQSFAAVGEVFGTGILGALVAFPLARFVLGREVLAFTFIIPFTISSVAGAALGLVLLRAGSYAFKKIAGSVG